MNAELSSGTLENTDLKNTDLQAKATVYNLVKEEMTLAGSHLDWGKWIESPTDVPAFSAKSFAAQGASLTPSGTEGWVSWKFHDAVIKVTFNVPAAGNNTHTIECTPANRYKVRCWGTQGKVDEIAYTITPA